MTNMYRPFESRGVGELKRPEWTARKLAGGGKDRRWGVRQTGPRIYLSACGKWPWRGCEQRKI